MVKAVIFDLWSTLAYNDVDTSVISTITKMAEIKDDGAESHRRIEESFMLRRYKSVKDGMEDFCRHFGKSERLAPELATVWSEEKLNIKIFDDVLPALKSLGKKYKLGLISNTQSFALEFFRDRKFFGNFDYVCLSCDVGLLKPDPEIFRLALRKLGVRPDEAVMVGDSLRSDVLGAEAVGIRGVLIKRPLRKKPGFHEAGTHRNTITDLSQLAKFLR
jgi:putative hydrolase of the HAD superfamily